MIYTREEHNLFLEEELKAITDEFQKKLDSQATFLLQEKGELFIAQFITFRSNGEMILKFPNTRALPRKGDYLYCFTVPKELRNYRNWGNKTYGDLLRQHSNHSEGIVCIWQEKDKTDDRYSIVSFRGVDVDFARNIAPAQFIDSNSDNSNLPSVISTDTIVKKDGIILLLGPNKPPFEYIANLQKIIQNSNTVPVCQVLDLNFIQQNNVPILLDSNSDISHFISSQLELEDTLILQGPPGTGKTHLIAQLCENLCMNGKSVLVTALTNRALIEVAEKPALVQMLADGKLYKSNLSADEKTEVKNLQPIKDIVPIPGNLVLSTFYFSSKTAADSFEQGQNFDYVIVDEASQAFLSTLSMSKILGKKAVWVGDCKQLAPIILINEDRINARKWNLLSDGFLAMTEYSTKPSYQLTDSYRLTERATIYTGCFYQNTLKSKTDSSVFIKYSGLSTETDKIFNQKGGPTLIKTELKIGETTPASAIDITAKLVSALMQLNANLHISVLTKRIATVKALQKSIFSTVGNNKNLLIDTVDRVQGLTTDVTFYLIPNTGYFYSLEKRLFNVATSRSRNHTIIIADNDILLNPHMDSEVKTYLNKLNEEFAFHIQSSKVSLDFTRVEKSEEQYVNDLTTKGSTILETDSVNENNGGIKVIGKIDLSRFEKPKKEIIKNKQNYYVIDTNVFVDCPDVISKIEKEYPIILSAKVIDELDYLKISLSAEQKKNVQKALRLINDSLDKRDVKMDTADVSLLPNDFNKKSPDNLILSVALKYKHGNPILLTSDNGLQIKAKGLGMSAISLRDFLKQIKIR